MDNSNTEIKIHPDFLKMFTEKLAACSKPGQYDLSTERLINDVALYWKEQGVEEEELDWIVNRFIKDCEDLISVYSQADIEMENPEHA